MAADTGAAGGKANLGTLNEMMFEEMRNLMSLDMGNEDAVNLELARAERVQKMASTVIDNANTVLRAVKQKDEMLDATTVMPKMLGA